MAQQNPNFGVAMVYDKVDFANAKTDEERALIHQRAEDRRSSYGGYTGGIDGSQYLMNNLSPINYTAPDKPTYSGSAYSNDLQNLWNQQMNYGSFSFNEAQPTYTNRYDERIQAKLDKVENPDPFSYNASTDPLYQQYRKEYTREGQRATADALGIAAAASGGLPSSYAQTAAGQAANYYAAQMTDKIPELYQLAYQKYLSDFQMQQAGLAALQTAEQSDYDKYRNLLNQYNINRDFARGIWNDEYNHLANNVSTAQSLSNQEYQQYLDALNQYNIDRNFSYGQYIDELNSQAQERTDKQNYAQLAANWGDYSYLNQLGIDTSNNPVDYERQYNEAILAKEMGNYDKLIEMGIIPNYNNMNDAALASAGKYEGNSGFYSNLGVSSGTYTGTGGTYTGSTSTGVDNEGLTWDQVVALQTKLGNIGVDGQIGPETRNALIAAGYTSAQQAYNDLIGAGAVLPAPESYTGSSTGSTGTRSYNNSQGDPEILAIQQQLNAAGYKVAEDGILGPETRAAVEKYNKDRESASTPKNNSPRISEEEFNAQLVAHEMSKISNPHTDSTITVYGIDGHGDTASETVTWDKLDELVSKKLVTKKKNNNGTYTYTYVGKM